jgi:predicted outer membrane repeat protein
MQFHPLYSYFCVENANRRGEKTMIEKRFFQLSLTAVLLLVLLAACDYTTINVSCSVPNLITAIHNANSHVSTTTINLASGCTYTLTAVDNSAIFTSMGSEFYYGDNGLPQIITPIIINGNGATIVRDSGAPDFRIFYITETGSLTINDLTLQNGIADEPGSAFPSSGGAIYVDKGTLVTNNATLQDNQASFHGGAIFVWGGTTTTINSSIIDNNNAPHGGGIFVYSSDGLLSVNESEVTHNSATTDGGGISLEFGAELAVRNSLIAYNHSDRRGGGIFKDAGSQRLPTTLNGTEFRENTAAWSGGAVFIWRTPLTISGCRFIGNQADEYGGALGYQNNSTEMVSISGTTFEGNTAGWNGGAIHFSGELMTLNKCELKKNNAVNGGAIHNGPAEDSRYIIRADTTVSITGSTFEDNSADEEGGAILNAGELGCGETSFVSNNAVLKGGGIANSGNLEVVGCNLERNEAGAAGGGIQNLSSAEIRVSDFTANTAEQGGAIQTEGHMTVTECNLTGNEAAKLGGGIHNNGEIKVEDCTFEKNIAQADGGGFNTYNAARISGSTFVGNTALRGGGLASVGGMTTLTNDTFSDNTAKEAGGAIFNMGALVGDTSSGGEMQANHITVTLNNAPSGSGIATSGGFMKTKNAIIALNPGSEDCRTNSAEFSGAGENLDSDDSCPDFTLKEDPKLDALANYGGPTFTHALKADSPAIDAAADCLSLSGAAVSMDQRGMPRPGGAACDLGAYEDQTGKPVKAAEPCKFTALINLNCRSGPDNTLYPVIDSFKAGQSALVVGQSWDKVFAYVEGPINKVVCAVPATERYGTLSGDCEELEVVIPPDVDTTYDKEEQGCLVRQVTGGLKCVVPCPPKAVPGNVCTP